MRGGGAHGRVPRSESGRDDASELRVFEEVVSELRDQHGGASAQRGACSGLEQLPANVLVDVRGGRVVAVVLERDAFVQHE